MNRVLALATVVLALVLPFAAGCGGTAAPEESSDGELLTVRDGSSLVGLEAATGVRRFALPPGLVSADGTAYLAAGAVGSGTVLRRYDARTGELLDEQRLPGPWRLGTVSAHGRFLALVRPAGRQTLLAVVDRRGSVSRISLDGDYDLDAISDDGSSLFLIERLGDERYAVRLYDLVAGQLHDGSIRPKNEDEEMVGVAGAQVGTPDGRWLLTLYVNTAEHEAFVHALNLRERFALCLDLPSAGASLTTLRGYALAVPRAGSEVYAANAALGVAARVGLEDLGNVRSLPLAMRSESSSTAATTSNGRMLWVASGRTLQGLDTAFERIVGPRTLARPAASLAFGRDGRLYAIAGDRIERLDASTGRPAGT